MSQSVMFAVIALSMAALVGLGVIIGLWMLGVETDEDE